MLVSLLMIPIAIAIRFISLLFSYFLTVASSNTSRTILADIELTPSSAAATTLLSPISHLSPSFRTISIDSINLRQAATL